MINWNERTIVRPDGTRVTATLTAVTWFMRDGRVLEFKRPLKQLTYRSAHAGGNGDLP